MSQDPLLLELEALKEKYGSFKFFTACTQLSRRRLEVKGRVTRKQRKWSEYKKLHHKQRGVCPWCMHEMALIRGSVEIDHVDPNAEDFNGDGNLLLLHQRCNREKGAMNLEQQAQHLGITIKELLNRYNAGRR